MIKNYLLLFLILSPLLLNSCATKGQSGALGGAAGGAILGQAIGGSTEGTLIGAAVGGLLGYIVGNEMDKFDRDQMDRAYETTPSRQTTTWENPDNGHHYAVTPQPAYQDRSGRNCREAEVLATIDGKAEKTVATACRENGRWVVQQ
jgi:surface antigen